MTRELAPRLSITTFRFVATMERDFPVRHEINGVNLVRVCRAKCRDSGFLPKAHYGQNNEETYGFR